AEAESRLERRERAFGQLALAPEVDGPRVLALRLRRAREPLALGHGGERERCLGACHAAERRVRWLGDTSHVLEQPFRARAVPAPGVQVTEVERRHRGGVPASGVTRATA